jgi:tellurite resistance protein
MYIFDVAKDHATLMLRAMRAVGVADGVFRAEERGWLESARDALALEGDVEAITPLTIDEARALDLAPSEREHVIQSMILTAIIDGELTESEAAVVTAFADALSVEEPRARNLAQLAHGRALAMKWDLTRKGYARDEFFRTAREEGFHGLYNTFGPIVGVGRDADVARKYNDLGKRPLGTLGRAYWEFIVQNDLSFPGEKGGLGERGVWHDMIHVMGGYPITPVGEAEVVAFMAGFRREDPFFWLFTVVLQFQIGLRISPFAPGVPHQIDPKSFARHHERGTHVLVDLSRDWDFRRDLDRPLADLRRELGVI